MTYSQLLYKKPLFNSVTDFAPVALLTRQPLVLIARKDLPAEGLQEFARHVKANKSCELRFRRRRLLVASRLRHAQPCDRSGGHARALSRRRAGDQDLIGGRIDYICNLIQDVIPHVKSGDDQGDRDLSPVIRLTGAARRGNMRVRN